jgi:hypothetical protein
MKIEKVSYQKLFPIGSFLNERIGFEASVDPHDDIHEVMGELKLLAESCHTPLADLGAGEQPIPEQQVEYVPKTKDEMVKGVIREIGTCKERKTLEAYHLLAKNNPEILPVYNKKMEEFV